MTNPLTILDFNENCWVEEPWLRYLLGPLAGDTVRAPTPDCIQPETLVVTNRLCQFDRTSLEHIRKTPRVGLFHISDEWYRQPLGSYSAFSSVWRQYAYTRLKGTPVRFLPLGPATSVGVGDGLAPASTVPASSRSYSVVFVGRLVTTRFAAAKALSTVPGARVEVSAVFDDVVGGLRPAEYLGLLRKSQLVACPMGNVHLETFRVYEALEAGAVPIVESRRGFDYWHFLLGDHPLLAVRRWAQAPALVAELTADPGALDQLQADVISWWTAKKLQMRDALEQDVLMAQDGSKRLAARSRLLDANPKLPAARELARHHNPTAVARRVQLTIRRLRRTMSSRRRPSY